MKSILILAAALALSACGMTMPTLTQAPAPLAATTIDDTALETAWRSFDAALDAINLLGDAKQIIPGTPRGKAVATAIRKVNSALMSAEHMAAAGSTKDYLQALAEAKMGIAELRTALRSN